MKQLQEIFSNRELALIIWTAIIGMFFAFKISFGKSFINLVRSFFAPKLTIVYLIMLLYTITILLILKYFDLWDFTLLKDSILWFTTFAIVTFFKIDKASNNGFFLKILNENFKLTLFLEFLSNFYSFNFWIEFFIFPFILIITLLKSVSELDSKNKMLTNLLSNIIAIIGLLYFVFAIYKTFHDYQNFFSVHNLNSLILPVLLSFVSIPLFYFLALYNTYEQLFLRLPIMNSDSKIQKKLKFQIFYKANLNLAKVNLLRDKLTNFDVKNVTDIQDKLNSII
ncbi:hypothetical protein [Flavobacterium reichenbachii]|uniref:Uncharacterized protein n=1 Tax=Flavobacterium reichenbachii TaxID=362418 RepID=A0A085ZN20_9FLAO|nr:hypothetical protein [Flavobacterium reichenbachii]KFF05834.1 hypothetical protein IW19_10000 [Flavobacterium reichenbachii]OXB12719.1 hypothetical protein B0A68_18195 [Flavobacterium reichenbachii]